ncbi:hypothetical protein GGR52DRAFT_267545 [Hypoxylon sp. FL1284]|nr:hypothetical protein GGR52DRAFT_267545 [Hypoxylon sp. FL1284]
MAEKRKPKESQVEAPDYITARRERGKLAQRAFRQRQIDTIRGLEDENQRLRDAISAICSASQSGMRLPPPISNACKVAGLPIAQVERRPSASAVTNSGDSGWSSSDSNDGTDNTNPTISLENCNPEFALPSVGNESNNVWPQSLPADGSAHVQSTAETLQDAGQDMSMLGSMYDESQTNFTAFMGVPAVFPDADRILQRIGPPVDILPYLGAGAYTLAGQIYWTAMAFGFQAIRAIISSPTPPPAAVDVVSESFSFTLRHVTLAQLMYMMYARLIFRRYGHFQEPADSGGDDRQYLLWALNPSVEAEFRVGLGRKFRREGVFKDAFLQPLAVERCLRERFQGGYAVIEAALSGQPVEQRHVACLRNLVQFMSRCSLCFGDGPRWTLASVETIMNRWEMSTSAIAVN